MKQGQPFKARISGVDIKGHINIQRDWIYLCNNELSGADTFRNGYKYSYAVTNPGGLKSHRVVLLDGPCKEVDQLDLESLTTFGAEIKGSKVIFGCGEVQYTKSELKAFTKIYSELKERKMEVSDADLLILKKHFS